jgi:hypothetical protein
MGSIEGAIHVVRVRARNLTKNLAGYGSDILEVSSGGGRDPLTANIVSVLLSE